MNRVAGTDLNNQPPILLFGMFPVFFLLILSPLYFPQLREVMRARRLYKKAGFELTAKKAHDSFGRKSLVAETWDLTL